MGILSRAFYSVGFWIRETGQALDRLGCRLQGNNCFRELLSRHRIGLGSEGCSAKYDKEVELVQAIGETIATEATGVGDLFASGFLYGVIKGIVFGKTHHAVADRSSML